MQLTFLPSYYSPELALISARPTAHGRPRYVLKCPNGQVTGRRVDELAMVRYGSPCCKYMQVSSRCKVVGGNVVIHHVYLQQSDVKGSLNFAFDPVHRCTVSENLALGEVGAAMWIYPRVFLISKRHERCHYYGYIVMDCSLNFSKKIWVKNMDVDDKVYPSSSHKDGHGVTIPSPSSKEVHSTISLAKEGSHPSESLESYSDLSVHTLSGKLPEAFPLIIKQCEAVQNVLYKAPGMVSVSPSQSFGREDERCRSSSHGLKEIEDVHFHHFLSREEGRIACEGHLRYLLRPRSKGGGVFDLAVEGGLGEVSAKGPTGPGSGRKSNLAPSKKQALTRLVEVYNLDILFLQETLGKGEALGGALSHSWKEWEFVTNDDVGRSWGLLLGWRRREFNCLNSIFITYGLGGDLNFVLGRMEVCGSSTNSDPLSDYFKANLERVGLLNVAPINNEQANFPDEGTKVQIKGLELRKRKLLDDNEALWRLKSKAMWLSKGDENTKFFHQYENFYLANAEVDHFDGIYKEKNSASLVEVIRMSSFFPSFMGEEDNGRLLGVEDLLRFIEESRLKGKVLGVFNTTFIALIPKSDNPRSFEEYRSISLCNCIYKIITKVNLNKSSISFVEVNEEDSRLDLACCQGGKTNFVMVQYMDLESKEKEGFYLVKWQTVAALKECGGVGHQEPPSLWKSFDSVEDWIRSTTQYSNGASVVWKVVVQAFPLVGMWLMWRVGNGSRVHIGQDPWVVSGIGMENSNFLRFKWGRKRSG
eukprot:Gb_20637 [translate_table: standard]